MTIDAQVHFVVRGGTGKSTSTHIAEREADTTLRGLANAGRGGESSNSMAASDAAPAPGRTVSPTSSSSMTHDQRSPRKVARAAHSTIVSTTTSAAGHGNPRSTWVVSKVVMFLTALVVG